MLSQRTQGLMFDAEDRHEHRQPDAVADPIKERFDNAALGRTGGLPRDGRRGMRASKSSIL